MVVGEDRPCPKCGYNVRGLAVGKPCPNCGRPIFFGLSALPDHRLADMPYWYISTQSAAAWLLFAGAMAAGAAMGAWDALQPVRPTAQMLAAVAWVMGVALLSAPRPVSRQERAKVEQEPAWLRTLAVGSQSLWVIAAGLALAPMPGSLTDLPMWLAIAAGVGLVPTMALMARAADFVGDPDRGKRLNALVLFLAVCLALWMMGLRVRVSLPLPSFGMLMNGTPLLMWVMIGGGAYALWNFYQLATTTTWAIQIARRQDEHVRNLRERFAQDRAERASAADREGFGGPVEAPIGSMMGIKPKRP